MFHYHIFISKGLITPIIQKIQYKVRLFVTVVFPRWQHVQRQFLKSLILNSWSCYYGVAFPVYINTRHSMGTNEYLSDSRTLLARMFDVLFWIYLIHSSFYLKIKLLYVLFCMHYWIVKHFLILIWNTLYIFIFHY